MIRVHNDVFASTAKRQSTWTNSSLNSSFFFNPGSLLLLTGNAMALAALLTSVIIYTLVLLDQFEWLRWAIAFALSAGALTTLLTGAQMAYSRMRGYRRDDPKDLSSHFWQSLSKGVLGGFLGSLIAAFPSGITYWWDWTNAYAEIVAKGDPNADTIDAPESLGAVLLEIAAASALVAILVGFLALFCSRVSISCKGMRFISVNDPKKRIAGSALGGALAGAIAAPALIRYFGAFSRPEMMPTMLLPGAIAGAATLAFAIVNFDFESLSRRRLGMGLLSALPALSAGALLAVPIFGPLYVAGIVQAVTKMLEDHFPSTPYLLFGGVVYGIPVGFIRGIVIALTALFTEQWSRPRAT
jgi:hypothetical protein